MLTKILSGALVVSVLASGVLYKLWENAQSEIAVLKANLEIINSVNEKNQQSIDRLTELAISNANSIESLGKQNETILQESLSHQTEINNLRASEAQKALEMPYERGNASHKRIVSQLVRFTGDNPRKDNSSDDKTVDSSGADPS